MARKYPILLALLSLFLFSECKKGENDPAVSLRTRKARIAGEWRLESGRASYTSTDGYNESYTFDGTNVKVNVTSYYPVVYTGKYSLSLKIEKDGTFSFKEIMAGEILEASGTWNFNSGVGEAKKKEEVIFFVKEVQKGYTNNGFNLFNRFSINFTYKITELRNKKLAISSAGKIYADSKSKYATLSTDYVFKQ